MVTDDVLKKAILDSELDGEYRKARRKAFKEGDCADLKAFKDRYGDDVARVADNLANSQYDRVRRVRKKIWRPIKDGTAYFVTLTFRDDVLDSTTEATRRRYVSRALKAVGVKYVANIDYGDKNNREHYHALIDPYPFCLASWTNGKRQYVDCPDFREWCNKYGFVTIERVGSSADDCKKVAKYTAKLSAHALKRSTQGDKVKAPRLIYSRKSY